MEKQKIVIIGLGVAIILVIQFFLISNLMEQKDQESLAMFQKGYDAGIESAIKSLFMKTEDCKTASIFINDTTRILLDYDCLETNP